MPACRTRSWRCATARWAGTSPGFTATAARRSARRRVSHGALAWAKSAAESVARKLGIQRIDEAALARLRAEATRTLYLFDVRDPDEYAAGHVAGALSAPGGQLVQATDQYVGTLHARIVVVDDKRGARRDDRLVARADGLARGVRAGRGRRGEGISGATQVLGEAPRDAAIDAAALNAMLARNEATVIDLSLSRDYREAHIPGAWFAIRARLEQSFRENPLRGNVVLTSEDGVLAALAVDGGARAGRRSRALSRRRQRRLARGRPFRSPPTIRAWPTSRSTLAQALRAPRTASAAMADYLAWETDLLPRIAGMAVRGLR